jgi:hypothetical protein
MMRRRGKKKLSKSTRRRAKGIMQGVRGWLHP